MAGRGAARVPGRAGAEIPGTGPQGGWHWAEWGCELVGTALLLLGGLSAVCWDFAPGSPVASAVPDRSARLLITGLLFAGSGSKVAISPLGRLSGAHLNPSVTLAFWLRGHMHNYDLAGYVVGPGGRGLRGHRPGPLVVGRDAPARSIWGSLQPGHGIGARRRGGNRGVHDDVASSGAHPCSWSPPPGRPAGPRSRVWILVAVLVWQGAPWTGTSLNPARSLAPALILPDTANLWAYLVGPLAGSLLAVAAFDAVPGVQTLTAKLFHDPLLPVHDGLHPAGRSSRLTSRPC